MESGTASLLRHYGDILRANGLAKRSIDNYLYSLKGFVRFLADRRLETATPEDIVAYQIQIASGGGSDSRIRVATYALRSFLRFVLKREDWNSARLPRPRRPKRLPEVLSPEEVQAILDATPAPKHRAAFMLCYGSGLRTEEVLNLKPEHVDSKRMVLRVERGKGQKDRIVVLPHTLLEDLRACWKRYRPQHYLFEGTHRGQPMAATTVQRAFRAARLKAGIAKHVTPRSMRHAFATHLVERGTPLRVVQTLLGHKSLNTTAVYTHLARTWLEEVESPLDALKTRATKT
jgi:site-specific recombinase XerD